MRVSCILFANMFQRYILSFTLLPLMFGGCAVGPDFSPPTVDVPASWRMETLAGAESIANLPWWEVYKDANLQQLVQEGLASNKDLKMALARLDQARAALGGSGAAFLPGVNYSGGAYRSYGRQGPGTPNPHGFSLAGNVQWEIDLWGRIRRLHESAAAQYAATAEDRNAVVLALVSEIAVGYVRLCSLDAQLVLAEETVKTRQASLDLAQLKLDAQTGNEIDVLRFKAELITARTSITSFKQAIQLQENALGVLVGRSPGPIARGGIPLPAVVLDQIPTGLPSDLLLRRPDIRGAEQRVRAANAQIGAAVANYFPRISLTGALGFINPSLGNLLESDSRGRQGGGSLLGPIFNGGAIYYSVKQAEAATREAVEAYGQAVLNAFREVNDALATLHAARALEKDLTQQVDALAKALEKIRQGTEGGLFSKLPELDADRALFAAQLQLADARTSALVASVRLYQVLGGGWFLDSTDTPIVNSKGEVAAKQQGAPVDAVKQ